MFGTPLAITSLRFPTARTAKVTYLSTSLCIFASQIVPQIQSHYIYRQTDRYRQIQICQTCHNPQNLKISKTIQKCDEEKADSTCERTHWNKDFENQLDVFYFGKTPFHTNAELASNEVFRKFAIQYGKNVIFLVTKHRTSIYALSHFYNFITILCFYTMGDWTFYSLQKQCIY